MDRRTFLQKSSIFLLGSFCGLGGASRAFSCEEVENKPFFQPRIALIIDDIGYSMQAAEEFLKLEIPITFSILPKLVNSQKLAFLIHNSGHETMLHQPMEPYNKNFDPGPGALYVSDSSEKITGIMEENITEIPYAAGVNNHMGSRFTASGREIAQALKVIGKNKKFFIDSLTSNGSKAFTTAKKLNITTTCRNVFLDNIRRQGDILSQLQKLERIAVRKGSAVGIGHPFPETAKAIEVFVKKNKQSDISMVHASRILYS